MADLQDDVRETLGSTLPAIQLGTILVVGAAATLVLVLVPGAVSGLVTAVTGSQFSAGTSLIIAGLLLVFGLYIVYATRRTLKYRIRAKLEETRREQAEMTIEKARSPILR